MTSFSPPSKIQIPLLTQYHLLWITKRESVLIKEAQNSRVSRFSFVLTRNHSFLFSTILITMLNYQPPQWMNSLMNSNIPSSLTLTPTPQFPIMFSSTSPFNFCTSDSSSSPISADSTPKSSPFFGDANPKFPFFNFMNGDSYVFLFSFLEFNTAIKFYETLPLKGNILIFL